MHSFLGCRNDIRRTSQARCQIRPANAEGIGRGVRKVKEDPSAVNSSMQSEISRLDRRIAAIVSGISSSSNFITTVTLRAAKETSYRTPIFCLHGSICQHRTRSVDRAEMRNTEAVMQKRKIPTPTSHCTPTCVNPIPMTASVTMQWRSAVTSVSLLPPRLHFDDRKIGHRMDPYSLLRDGKVLRISERRIDDNDGTLFPTLHF